MQNVQMTVDEKGILTVKIDLNQDFGPSKSGKTTIIASSCGNQKVDGAKNGAVIGINCYKK